MVRGKDVVVAREVHAGDGTSAARRPMKSSARKRHAWCRRDKASSGDSGGSRARQGRENAGQEPVKSSEKLGVDFRKKGVYVS